ncbi:MAG: hypothetical protein AUH86_08720 [Acidobacteria bacterium 13_1_40CM_4_58_4]|nr:MAG: hypothetical protein AUH86_08720 [Acidobacteria bacterium 13_1_40CM_4_58_4]
MRPGLVTIMMPVLNGELFLPFALDSLLSQAYESFEIVILDNQSTDRTPDICREYARRDGRIRYILDDVNRITHDAGNHLATYSTGEFCVFACDDDLWEPTFLSTLVSCLQMNPDVGLAYCNAALVNVDGRRSRRRLLKRSNLRNSSHSQFMNFWHYARGRRVVPILFGVYRSSILQKVLPFDTFDETTRNVDNLFILKLITLTRVHCTDQVLFFYRNKYRGWEASYFSRSPQDRNRLKMWVYDVKHEWRFLKRIFAVLDNSAFNWPARVILKGRSLYSFVLFISVLRFRAVIGKLFVRWGIREGPPLVKDIHHERRLEAHRNIDFKALASAKHMATKGERLDR